MVDSRREDMLDRAIDFSLGLLSAEEERSLLERAGQDPEFEDMLRRQCASLEHARAQGMSRDDRAARSASAMKSGRSFRRCFFRSRGLVLVGAAVAASLAVLLLLEPRPSTDLFWLPVDAALSTPRSSGPLAGDWRAGVELYAARELAAAIQALQGSDVQGATAELRDLYLASALLNDGRSEEAGAVLGRIDLEILPHPWRGYGEEIQRRFERSH